MARRSARRSASADWIAAHALAGLIAKPATGAYPQIHSRDAYTVADAMLCRTSIQQL